MTQFILEWEKRRRATLAHEVEILYETTSGTKVRPLADVAFSFDETCVAGFRRAGVLHVEIHTSSNKSTSPGTANQ